MVPAVHMGTARTPANVQDTKPGISNEPLVTEACLVFKIHNTAKDAGGVL